MMRVDARRGCACLAWCAALCLAVLLRWVLRFGDFLVRRARVGTKHVSVPVEEVDEAMPEAKPVAPAAFALPPSVGD